MEIELDSLLGDDDLTTSNLTALDQSSIDLDALLSDDGGISLDQLLEPPKPRDIISQRLKEHGYYNSFTESMSGPMFGEGRKFARKPDGNWDIGVVLKAEDGPIDSTVNALHQLAGTKLGLSNENPLFSLRKIASYGFVPGHNPQEVQDVFHRAQQEGNFSDEQMAEGVEDLRKASTKFKDEEKARVLSDGTVLPNMESSDWLDDEKAKTILDSLPISKEAKSKELSSLRAKQDQIASMKLMAYNEAAFMNPTESPSDYAERTGRAKDFGSKEFMIDYERDVASKAGWGSGLVTDFHGGHQKLLGTTAGALGLVTGSENIAKFAASVMGDSGLRSRGSFDTGLVGGVIEEIPSIIAIGLLTRGVGAGATAIGATEAVATNSATAAMLATSFAQSAGAQFASAIEEGDTISQARAKGVKAGLTTAVVTGLFQVAGAGGLEKQLVGKNAAQTTVKDLQKAFKNGNLWDATRKLATELGMAVAPEGAEELIDEAIQSFVTADPDTNLADAWENAWEAAKIGGLIGGVAHVAGGELESIFGKRAPDALRLAPKSTEAALEAFAFTHEQGQKTLANYTEGGIRTHAQFRLSALRGKNTPTINPITGEEVLLTKLTDAETNELGVLEELMKDEASFDADKAAALYNAKVLRKAQEAPATPAGAATAPKTPVETTFSLGGSTFTANDNTPQAKLEALFGPAKEGREWRDDVDVSKMVVGKDGRISYDGEVIASKIENGKVVSTSGDRVAGISPMAEFTTKSKPLPEAAAIESEDMPKPVVTTKAAPKANKADASPESQAKAILSAMGVGHSFTAKNGDVFTLTNISKGRQFEVRTKLGTFIETEEDASARLTSSLGKESKPTAKPALVVANAPSPIKKTEAPSSSQSAIAASQNQSVESEYRSERNPDGTYDVIEITSNGKEISHGLRLQSQQAADWEIGNFTTPENTPNENTPNAKREDNAGSEASSAEGQASNEKQGEAEGQVDDEVLKTGVDTEEAKQLKADREKQEKALAGYRDGLEKDPTDPSWQKLIAAAEKKIAGLDAKLSALSSLLSAPGPTAPSQDVVDNGVNLSEAEALSLVSITPDGRNEIVGNNTAAGPLQVDVMINVTKENGDPLHSYVVTGFYIREDGEIIHVLSPPLNNDRVLTSEEYRDMRPVMNEKELDNAMRLLDVIVGPSKSDAVAIAGVKRIIRMVMARVASQRAMNRLLRFADGVGRGVYNPQTGLISVDPEVWIDILRDGVSRVASTSAEAEMLVEDWVAEIEGIIFEELHHQNFHEQYMKDPEVAFKAINSLIDAADESDEVLNRLHEAAIGRYHHGFVHGGKLAGITKDQLLSLLRGKEVNGVLLTKDEFNKEKIALAAEFSVAFYQSLHAGMTNIQMAAAAHRFAVDLVGKPTGLSKSKLGTMLKRITELLRRAVESMQRFLHAHRVAATLPADFYEFSIELDKLIASKGIVAPDPTKVMDRFNRGAAAKMAAVDAVQAILAKRTFDKNVIDPRTGEEKVIQEPEFEVKRRVRDIVRHSLSINDLIKPVTLDPLTGKLVMHENLDALIGEEMAASLEADLKRLNNPTLSSLALETAAIAQDVRNVLRYMNSGIPTTARGGVADAVFADDMVIGRGAFSSGAAMLKEVLTSEAEKASGFSIDQLLLQYNRAIDAINRSTSAEEEASDARFVGTGAVEKAIDEAALPEWVDVKNTIKANEDASAEIDKEMLQISSAIDGKSTKKEKAKAKAEIAKLAEKRKIIDSRIDALKLVKGGLIAQYAVYSAPEESATNRFTSAQQAYQTSREALRNSLRSASRIQRAAEREMEAKRIIRNRGAQQARDISDLAHLSRDEIELLFSDSLFTNDAGEGTSLTPGIDAPRLEAVFSKYHGAALAHARTSMLPEHLEYALLGGVRPRTLPRAAFSDERTTVGQYNLSDDGSRDLLPLSAGRVLWGYKAEGGFTSFGENIPIEVEDAILGEYTFTTAPDLDPEADIASLQINSASRAVSGLLGYNQDDVLTAAESIEKSSIIRKNSKDIARRLTDSFAVARINGDEGALGTSGIDSLRFGRLASVEEGGFPSFFTVDDRGKVRPYMRTDLFTKTDLPEIILKPNGDMDFEATVTSIFQDGAAADVLLEAIAFMRSIEGTDENYTQASMWTIGGMTPAGAAYAVVTPRFLQFLSLTKENEGSAGSYQQMMIDHLEGQGRNFDAMTLRKAFDQLEVGLHLANGFKASRSDLKSIQGAFYKLRESMVSADTIYKEALHYASNNLDMLYDSLKDGIADESRSPIDEDVISNHNVNTAQIRTSLNYLRGQDGQYGDQAISLLRPISSSMALRLLDNLEAERKELHLVGQGIDSGRDVSGFFTQGSLDSDTVRLIEQGSNRQEDINLIPTSTQMSNAQNEYILEQYRKAKELHMKKEERVITQIGLMLSGGSEAALRRMVNDPVFAYFENDRKMWNRTGLKQHLTMRLEKLRNQEVASGNIVSHSRSRNGNPAISNETFNKALRDIDNRSNSKFSGIIKAIKLSERAEVHFQTSSAAFSVEAFPSEDRFFDTSHTSVIHGLLSRIANVTIVTGSVRRDRQYGDKDTQVPSLAFIPDKENPVLLVPYGTIDPTKEEAELAIDAILGWLHDNGDVNITALAKPFVDKLALLGEPGLRTLESNYRIAFERYRENMGITVVPNSTVIAASDSGRVMRQSDWDDQVDGWMRKTKDQIVLALSKITGAGESDILSDEVVQLARIADGRYGLLTSADESKADEAKRLLDVMLYGDQPINKDEALRLAKIANIKSKDITERINTAIRRAENLADAEAADLQLPLANLETGEGLSADEISRDFLYSKGMNPARWAQVKRSSRRILTSLLSNPSARELLLLATTNPNLSKVSEIDRALFGNMIGFSNVPGMDLTALRDNALFFSTSNTFTGFVDTVDDGIATIGDKAIEDLESLTMVDDQSDKYSPIGPAQVEWATADLYNLISKLRPITDPSAQIKGKAKERGLTLFESMQLLSVFGHNGVAAALEDKLGTAAERRRKWANPEVVQNANPTWNASLKNINANDIMNATGEAAENLQSMFRSWANVGVYPGSRRSRNDSLEQAARHGTYTMIDGSRNRWEENRKAKGALLYAQLAGIDFVESDTGSKSATVAPDLKEMEANLNASGHGKWMVTTIDSTGARLPLDENKKQKTEMVSAFEAMRREVFFENKERIDAIKAIRDRAMQASMKFEFMEEVKDLIDQALVEEDVAIDDLRARFPESNPESSSILKMIDAFSENRDALARDLALGLIQGIENIAAPRIEEESPLFNDIQGVAQLHYKSIHYYINTIKRSNVNPLLPDRSLFKAMGEYNSVISRLFRELGNKAPHIFKKGLAKDFRLTGGMTVGSMERTFANLVGFLKNINDPKWIQSKSIEAAREAAVKTPLRDRFETGSSSIDRSVSSILTSLSPAAQDEVLNVVSAYGFKPGERIGVRLNQGLVPKGEDGFNEHAERFRGVYSEAELKQLENERLQKIEVDELDSLLSRRAGLINRITSIIRADIYSTSEEENAKDLRSTLKAKSNQLKEALESNDIKKFDQILAVFRKTGYNPDEASEDIFGGAILRSRAILKMLKDEALDASRISAANMKILLEQEIRWGEPAYRISAFRDGGGMALKFVPGVPINSKQFNSSSQDAEIAYRVLNAYGKAWSDLYMQNYSRSNEVIGMEKVRQSTEAADIAAIAGFGTLTSKVARRARYNIVDDLLIPEKMIDRVNAVLRSRKVKSARKEVVLARLERHLRNEAGKPVSDTSGMTRAEREKFVLSSDLRKSASSLGSMIDEIKAGGYSKSEVGSFLDNEILSTKKAISAIPKRVEPMGAGGKPYMEYQSLVRDRPIIRKNRVNQKALRALRSRLRRLERRKAEFESGAFQKAWGETENEAPATIPSLFAPVLNPAYTATAETFANSIIPQWSLSPAGGIAQLRANMASIKSGVGKVFANMSSDDATRDQMRFMLFHGKHMALEGQLVGIENRAGEDVSINLSAALSAISNAPSSKDASAKFYKAYNEAYAALEAKAAAELMAIGYVKSDTPVETTGFFRNFLHTSAKVTGVFAKSDKAVESVNDIFSIVRKGAGGNTGKDRALLQTQATNKFLSEAALKIDKKSRFVKTAQGYKLAQIRTNFDVATTRDEEEKIATRLLDLTEASSDAIARANRKSRGGNHAAGAFGALASYIPKKLRQLYNFMAEKGFHQLDNQYVELDMIRDMRPLLEKVKDGSLSSTTMIKQLETKWGKDATNYETAIIDSYSENLKGFKNTRVMMGKDPKDIAKRPLVPFIWTNQSIEASTSRRTGSMGDMLNPDRSIWRRSQNRKWDNQEDFDLLDFDGITSPMRVLQDMIYRTFVAPSYDVVSEIVGDVSTASQHFSQYDKDELGARHGFVSSVAATDIKDRNMAARAADGALAVSNMVRDELSNDLGAFSANNRAIALYRKIAIIGLAQKLFSVSQAYAQPIAPVVGYATFGGKRGVGFIPYLVKYWGSLASNRSQNAYHRLIQSLVSESGPVIAQRGPDGNAMLEEVMKDHRLSGQEIHNPAVLGRAGAVLGPALRTGGSVVDLTAKAASKTLEYLIGRPEGFVIVPMLAHEIWSEVNESKVARGEAAVTMDSFLNDPHQSGMTPLHVQKATVRVEQLFGTSDKSQRAALSQPSKTIYGEIWRSLLTTLSGHPITMAANSWASWRQIGNNPMLSKEWNEGMRVLGMTATQNLVFALGTAPALTYLISSIIAAISDWDEEERQNWEGQLYGIVPGEDPEERRKHLSYWIMSMLGRNEDPYGYSWHQGEFSEEQKAKHDGYRNARIVQEVINQSPIFGSLTSTTLGQSLLSAGMKASGLSPDSRLKQAGIILPEKWGFSGEGAESDGDAGRFERSVYLATKFWNNYLNDANSIAFAADPFLQAAKMAANDPQDLDFTNVMLILASLVPTKPREASRAIMRQHSLRNDDFEWAAPYE